MSRLINVRLVRCLMRRQSSDDGPMLTLTDWSGHAFLWEASPAWTYRNLIKAIMHCMPGHLYRFIVRSGKPVLQGMGILFY